MTDQWMSPKYQINGTITSRVRYFDGQYLKDQDFIDDQLYHTDRQQRHERLLHVAGILEGLDLDMTSTTVVTVSPGAALDDMGRQILLDAPRTLNVSGLGAGSWSLVIRFDELGDRIPNDNLGAPQATRFKQTPLLELVPTGALPAHAVILGEFEQLSEGPVFSYIGRVYSGLRLPGPSQTSFALRAKGDGSPGWAELNASLSITGDASLTGNCSAQKLNINAPSGLPQGTIGSRELPVEMENGGGELVIFAANAHPFLDRMVLRAPSFRFQTYPLGSVVDIDSSEAISQNCVHIAGNGNVGIGDLASGSAGERLSVGGSVRVNGHVLVNNGNVVVHNGLTLTSGDTVGTTPQSSESFVINDRWSADALVLIGNTSGGGGRARVEVRQDLNVTGNLTTAGSATAATLTVSGGATIGSNAGSTVNIGASSGTTVHIGTIGGSGATVNLRGNVTTNGNVTVTSSAAVKERIQTLPAEEALSVFRHLTPVTYAYKDDLQKRLLVGFIAEDVPELVGTPDRTAIAPFSILAVLTRVVQAHDQALQALERRLDAMKGNPAQ